MCVCQQSDKVHSHVCKTNGANEWDYVGRDGIVLMVMESGATEGGGEVEDGWRG
jgi:hypothetical protein